MYIPFFVLFVLFFIFFNLDKSNSLSVLLSKHIQSCNMVLGALFLPHKAYLNVMNAINDHECFSLEKAF